VYRTVTVQIKKAYAYYWSLSLALNARGRAKESVEGIEENARSHKIWHL